MTNAQHSTPPVFNVGETTDYIATLSKELAILARTQRLDFLAYLLEMAAHEAQTLNQNIPIKLPKKALSEKTKTLKNGKVIKTH